MLCILDLSPTPGEKSSKSSMDQSNTDQSKTAAASPLSGSPANSSEAGKKSTGPARRTGEVPVSEPVNIPEEPAGEPVVQPEAAVARDENEHGQSEYEQGEYELVLGRRQIASWLFVGTLLIAMFSTAAYYAGRMSAPNPLADLDGKSELYVAPPLPEATMVLPGQDPNVATSTGVMPGPISATAPGAVPETTPSGTSPGGTAPGGTNPGRTTAASPPVPQTPIASAAAGAAPVSSVPGTIIREWNTNPPVSGEPPLFANPQAGALYLQMGAVDKGIAVVLAEGLRRHGFNSLVAPGPREKIFRVLIGPFATQEDFKRAKAEVDAIDLGTFARRYQK